MPDEKYKQEDLEASENENDFLEMPLSSVPVKSAIYRPNNEKNIVAQVKRSIHQHDGLGHEFNRKHKRGISSNLSSHCDFAEAFYRHIGCSE